MTKEPTKAELAKLVLSLQRKVTKLEKKIAELEQSETPHPLKPLAFKAEREIREQIADAEHGAGSTAHVTPLPTNAYGPFPWEPKR